MEGTPRDDSAFLSKFREQGFDDKDLDHGGAIMTHDALQTAVNAVRLAAPGTSPPTAGKVRGVLLNLNGQFQVRGPVAR